MFRGRQCVPEVCNVCWMKVFRSYWEEWVGGERMQTWDASLLFRILYNCEKMGEVLEDGMC